MPLGVSAPIVLEACSSDSAKSGSLRVSGRKRKTESATAGECQPFCSINEIQNDTSSLEAARKYVSVFLQRADAQE
jgi:hypothetical protein